MLLKLKVRTGIGMNEKEISNAGDFAEVVDLDGEPFEIIAELEHEGELYFALIPFNEDENSEDTDEDEEIEFIVLKKEASDEASESDEFFLVTLDDEKLSDKLGGMFLEMFEGE